MSTKKVVHKLSKIVTRSTGLAQTAEPVADLTLSHAQASSSTSETEPRDRDIGVLGSSSDPPIILTKLQTQQSRESNYEHRRLHLPKKRIRHK